MKRINEQREMMKRQQTTMRHFYGKKTSRKTVKEQANEKKRIASPFSLLSLNMGKEEEEEEEKQTCIYWCMLHWL
jgi:hypothetical protein